MNDAERFKLITDAIEDVFWIGKRDFSHLHYVSPSYERILGRPIADLYANHASYLDHIHPDDRERVARAGTEVDHEYRIVRGDGAIRWISSRRFLVRGTTDLCVGIVKDITDEKRVAADHAETLERFRFVARATNEGIWDWDMVHNTTWWSDANYTLYGLDPKQTPPSYEAWLAVVHPEDRARVVASFARALDAGETAWTEEYRIQRSDGSVIDVLDRAHVLIDSAGKPIRMVGAAMDITRRRALEAQLRHAQKMEAVGQLAGGVAHDYNNLLQAAKLELALLRDASLPGPVAVRVAELGVIVERAASLTRQLLVFSRREAMRKVRIDLNSSIIDIARMLRRVLGEDIALHLDLSPGALAADVDSSMLDQVLINLAVNARDAMPDGGALTIATAIRPTARPGKHACITVRDTGVGIAHEHLSRIFEPFFTTKEPGRGTGLGLATVHGIVDQHGGWIEVSSEPGRGTTFDVFFPAAITTASTHPQQRLANARGGSETILVVEDDQTVRRSLRAVLERAGYRVMEADRGSSALASWDEANGAIDLVLADMMMPGGMSGRELAERLVARRPNVRIVFVTGYSDQAVDARHELLHKPVDTDQLLGVVRASLDRVADHA